MSERRNTAPDGLTGCWGAPVALGVKVVVRPRRRPRKTRAAPKRPQARLDTNGWCTACRVGRPGLFRGPEACLCNAHPAWGAQAAVPPKGD